MGDVGEEGELAGDGAGVVERGGVGGEVEAEEGVCEAPGLVSVYSTNSSPFASIAKEIKDEEGKEREGVERKEEKRNSTNRKRPRISPQSSSTPPSPFEQGSF